MSGDHLTHHQLLRWAMNVVAREAQSELYGTVTFTMNKGRIITVRTERTEKPALDVPES